MPKMANDTREKTRRLQRKLYLAAKRSRKRRFHAVSRVETRAAVDVCRGYVAGGLTEFGCRGGDFTDNLGLDLAVWAMECPSMAEGTMVILGGTGNIGSGGRPTTSYGSSSFEAGRMADDMTYGMSKMRPTVRRLSISRCAVSASASG